MWPCRVHCWGEVWEQIIYCDYEGMLCAFKGYLNATILIMLDSSASLPYVGPLRVPKLLQIPTTPLHQRYEDPKILE